MRKIYADMEDPTGIWSILPEGLIVAIKRYLCIDCIDSIDTAKIRCDGIPFDVDIEEDEEIDLLMLRPPIKEYFTISEFTDHVNRMSFGKITFGEYRGHKLVVIQNAHPPFILFKDY